MPIKNKYGEVLGVAQVVNKRDGPCFTAKDERVFANYLQFCGIGLGNAHLYQQSRLEVKRTQVLLDLARMIFEEQSTIEHMVYRILTHTLYIMQCQRAQILLLHESSSSTFSRVFDLDEKDLRDDDADARSSPFEGRFPINIGITGFVATTGEVIDTDTWHKNNFSLFYIIIGLVNLFQHLNITNVYEDSRFDQSVDEGTDFVHRDILCMPIRNSEFQVIGVVQVSF